jgi:hypothetical protein
VYTECMEEAQQAPAPNSRVCEGCQASHGKITGWGARTHFQGLTKPWFAYNRARKDTLAE